MKKLLLVTAMLFTGLVCADSDLISQKVDCNSKTLQFCPNGYQFNGESQTGDNCEIICKKI